MLNKIRARLSIGNSNELPTMDQLSKSATIPNNKNIDDDMPAPPSLSASLSATISNVTRSIGQDEIVHDILLGIKQMNVVFKQQLKNDNNQNDQKDPNINTTNTANTPNNDTDFTKLSSSELEKLCKSSTKIVFPSVGSDYTSSHLYTNFDFEIYAPKIFDSLRQYWNVQNDSYSDDFLYKLCGIYDTNQIFNIKKSIKWWKTLLTNSKSGQLFYKTRDTQFIIKSMSKKECNFLRNNLNKYYSFMFNNSDSLICSFLGLYRVNIQFQKSIYILIQKSVLYSYPHKLHMDKLYDLKGSTFGRQATRYKVFLDDDDMEQVNKSIKNRSLDLNKLSLDFNDIKDADIDDIKLNDDNDIANNIDEAFSTSFYMPDMIEQNKIKTLKSTSNSKLSPIDQNEPQSTKGAIFKRSRILKDLDFLKDKQKIFIGKKRKKVWLKQLEKDVIFLTTLNVMDYSILLGIHYKDIDDNGNNNDDVDAVNNVSVNTVVTVVDRWKKGELYKFDHGGMSYHVDDDVNDNNLDINDNDQDLSQDYDDDDDDNDQPKNCIYFCGIIDILQSYNAKKKVENLWMGLKTDNSTISSVKPGIYSTRLLNFMKKGLD